MLIHLKSCIHSQTSQSIEFLSKWYLTVLTSDIDTVTNTLKTPKSTAKSDTLLHQTISRFHKDLNNFREKIKITLQHDLPYSPQIVLGSIFISNLVNFLHDIKTFQAYLHTWVNMNILCIHIQWAWQVPFLIFMKNSFQVRRKNKIQEFFEQEIKAKKSTHMVMHSRKELRTMKTEKFVCC